jgi:predicted DNA-binding transcriptional regulator AlpA
MTTRKPNLSDEEIARPFQGELGEQFPTIISPVQLADLVGISVKTMYEWINKGRLDGAFRKRGKRLLIWRDRALAILFDGKGWK